MNNVGTVLSAIFLLAFGLIAAVVFLRIGAPLFDGSGANMKPALVSLFVGAGTAAYIGWAVSNR